MNSPSLMRAVLAAAVMAALLLAACDAGGGESDAPLYTLAFDGNGATGGTVPAADAKYAPGANVQIPGNAGNLEKTGSSFSGWNTRADGGGTTYTQGQTFVMPAADATLYAKWTIIAAPPEKNADLSALTVNSGALNPAFSPATTSYSVGVEYETASITVTGTPAEAGATAAYVPAQPVSLVEGANVITVTVTSADGTVTKDYTVTVTRFEGDYTSPTVGTLKYVPAGTFQRDADPANVSTVSAFRMATTEVTRTQFQAVLGDNPSHASFTSGTGDPVQMVNWYHAIAFCNKLSLAEGLTPVYSVSGVDFAALTYAEIPVDEDLAWKASTADWEANGYRLPTEMEGMWAAMGATSGHDYSGGTYTTGYAKAFAGSDGTNTIDDYVWYDGNSSTKTHPAGEKAANELGLYDLSGNVTEWCWDWYAAYPAGALVNYRGPATPTDGHVGRGGNFYYPAADCAVASRSGEYCAGYFEDCNIGFRVVRR